ncbi:MAG: hypothetical protein ACE5G9_00615 [Nitrospinales bacterium]
MPIKIVPKTFRMAREEQQLEEILQKASAAAPGTAILFPEYGAYTVKGSEKAYNELSKAAVNHGVTLITSLNHPGEDLPHASPKTNYNTLFIFSRTGRIYSPQAKITPQSFELRHRDESFPRMDVTPYSYLNKVTLRQNGAAYAAFFFICSDLYVLPLFDARDLKSDAIICPANFGNGSEQAAGGVIEHVVKSGLFHRGFLSNSCQVVEEGVIPFTVAVEKAFENETGKIVFDKRDLDELLENSCAIYSDEEYRNFKSVLAITLNGTFAVPRSRSLENGLKVNLGAYERVVEL